MKKSLIFVGILFLLSLTSLAGKNITKIEGTFYELSSSINSDVAKKLNTLVEEIKEDALYGEQLQINVFGLAYMPKWSQARSNQLAAKRAENVVNFLQTKLNCEKINFSAIVFNDDPEWGVNVEWEFQILNSTNWWEKTDDATVILISIFNNIINNSDILLDNVQAELSISNEAMYLIRAFLILLIGLFLLRLVYKIFHKIFEKVLKPIFKEILQPILELIFISFPKGIYEIFKKLHQAYKEREARPAKIIPLSQGLPAKYFYPTDLTLLEKIWNNETKLPPVGKWRKFFTIGFFNKNEDRNKRRCPLCGGHGIHRANLASHFLFKCNHRLVSDHDYEKIKQAAQIAYNALEKKKKAV